MPGKRKSSSSGTTYKRSKTAEGRKKVNVKYSGTATTAFAKKVAANMQSAGLVGLESKFFDTDQSTPRALTAPTGCTGGVVNLTNSYIMNAPIQGNSATTREGNVIDVRSVAISGFIQVARQTAQTQADNACICTLFLVQDTQTNAAQCTSETIFTNPSASSILAHAPFRNLVYTKRFKVLAKKQITIAPPDLSWNGTTIEQNGIMRPFNIYKKLKMPVHFTGGTGDSTIGGIMDNSLHVVAFCNNTDLAPAIAFNARVRFFG